VSGELLSILTDRRDATAFITAAGELDVSTVDSLEREIRTAEQGDAEEIVLDLSGLTFVDSTGLRLVLEVNSRCGGDTGRLRVIGGSASLERLLDVVGLRERLPLISP
jgi:anti-anti-sigma factor